MNIQDLDLKALKALAYDQLVQLEQAQSNLKVINAEISKRNNPMEKEVEATEVVEEVETNKVVEESAE